MTYTEEHLRESAAILQMLDVAAIEKVVEVLAGVKASGGRFFFLGVGGQHLHHQTHGFLGCIFFKFMGIFKPAYLTQFHFNFDTQSFYFSTFVFSSSEAFIVRAVLAQIGNKFGHDRIGRKGDPGYLASVTK